MLTAIWQAFQGIDPFSSSQTILVTLAVINVILLYSFIGALFGYWVGTLRGKQFKKDSERLDFLDSHELSVHLLNDRWIVLDTLNMHVPVKRLQRRTVSSAPGDIRNAIDSAIKCTTDCDSPVEYDQRSQDIQ